jgi:hypothetical protein
MAIGKLGGFLDIFARRESLSSDAPVGFFSRPATFSRKRCY